MKKQQLQNCFIDLYCCVICYFFHSVLPVHHNITTVLNMIIHKKRHSQHHINSSFLAKMKM